VFEAYLLKFEEPCLVLYRRFCITCARASFQTSERS